jgi:hypothetical protein
VHKRISTLCLVFVFGFTLNGCSSMSPQARRERAYRHYVQKQIKKRQRDIARAQKAANRQLKQRLKSNQISEPQVTTSLEDGSPQAFSEPVTAPQERPTFKDPIVEPITVSASASVPAETEEPSQP